jgi:hypothetical protein
MSIAYGSRPNVFGKDSKLYQPVWRNFGGTAYASFGTNVANNTLFTNKSTYDSIVIPYEISGVMASQINENFFNYWANKENTMWYKRMRSYTTSGPYTSNAAIHADVYLKFTGGATYQKVINGLGAGYTDLGGDVSMSIYLGTAQTYYDYGTTRYAYSSGTTSLGFANDTDSGVPAGQSVMGNGQSIYSSAGWEARHVISYNHTTTGRDVTRCQFLCWADISGVVEETTWYARSLTPNEL